MRRAAVLAVLVAACAAVAWRFAMGGGDAPDGGGGAGDVAQEVERYLAAGDIAEARRALAADRDSLPPGRADYLDAIVLFAARDFEGASKAALRASAASPGDWRATSVLYYAELQCGRRRSAHDALAAFLAAHPGDERAMAEEARWLVEIETERPDPEKALAILDEIARLPARKAPPGDPTAVSGEFLNRLRAQAETLRGRFGAAAGAAEDRVKASPRDAEAWYQLAVVRRRGGNWPGAVEALQKCVEIEPGRAEWTQALLTALLESDETGEACLPLAEKLLQMRPGDAAAEILLARTFGRLQNRNDDGITLYRRLLLRPDLGSAQRLEALRNCAVALFDWKAAGKDGEYLDEAHRLLAEYVRSGGVIDERLQDVASQLEERARLKGGAPGPR